MRTKVLFKNIFSVVFLHVLLLAFILPDCIADLSWLFILAGSEITHTEECNGWKRVFTYCILASHCTVLRWVG